MPAEQSLCVQWLVIRLRRVQHHLDDPIDMAIRRDQPADFEPQPFCNGRPNLILVERLAFDLAALDDITGESSQHRLIAKIKAKALHASQELALPVADSGKL